MLQGGIPAWRNRRFRNPGRPRTEALVLESLILVCQLIGEVSVLVTGLPVPGPVLGMLLLPPLLRWIGLVG